MNGANPCTGRADTMFNPNAPYTGYTNTYASGAQSELGQSGDTRGVSGGQYPDVSPSLAPILANKGVSDEEIRYWYDALQKNATALQQASGWDKIKFQAQRDDLQKGLDNARALQQMQSETQRYGIDQTRQGQIAQLEENRRQFNANHGLAVADAYTRFASTPDDLFQLQDEKANIGAASSGGYQSSLQQQGQPHAKTWGDFAALSGFDTPAVQANQSAGGQATNAANGTSASGGGAGGGDKRVSAANAVMRALPPSGGQGHDQQDWAALNAIQNLYFGAKPGQVERLDPVQQREAQSGLRRLGWNAEQVDAQRRRSLPGQGYSNAA